MSYRKSIVIDLTHSVDFIDLTEDEQDFVSPLDLPIDESEDDVTELPSPPNLETSLWVRASRTPNGKSARMMRLHSRSSPSRTIYQKPTNQAWENYPSVNVHFE